MSGPAQSFTVELRDYSPNARAERESLVRRYNGQPGSSGDKLIVRTVDRSTAQTLFALLEADPRVISNAERAAQAAQERYAAHQAEMEAAKRADRIAQLEARNAEHAARIADLEQR